MVTPYSAVTVSRTVSSHPCLYVSLPHIPVTILCSRSGGGWIHLRVLCRVLLLLVLAFTVSITTPTACLI
jgi:hypothetical protein